MWERRSLNLPSLAWMDKPEGATKWSNSNPLPGMGKWESFPIRPFFGPDSFTWLGLINSGDTAATTLFPR